MSCVNNNENKETSSSEASSSASSSSSSSSSSSPPSRAASPPPFDYLVVIDFEATCDEGPAPRVTKANQEIIEFPVVAFNLLQNEVEFAEQIYVRPQWNPELTAFCTRLTSITDETLLEKGVTLAEAVKAFDELMRDRITARGRRFCIVTDGDWDLKLLIREAKAKGISLAPHFFSYIDLKKEFVRVTEPSSSSSSSSSRFSVSFRQMMRLLEIPHSGHHHLGIDDAKNMAGIVKELLARSSGRSFDEESIISLTNYDPDQPDPDYVDFNVAPIPVPSHLQQQQQPSYQRNGQIRSLSYSSPSITSTSTPATTSSSTSSDSTSSSSSTTPTPATTATTTSSTVIFIRGLPWSANEQDLVEFFEGIPLERVHILREKPQQWPQQQQQQQRHNNNPNNNQGLGRSTGTGFVVLQNPDDLAKAWSKNRQYLQNRYLELYSSNSKDMEQAIANFAS